MQASYKMDGITEVFPGFVLAPTGGKVMYVHASGAGALDYLPPGMSGNPDGFFQSIASAVAGTRAGRGDKIIALQGHTESLAAADAWAFGSTNTDVEIVGMGTGTNRPTLTWTAAGSTLLMDQANIKLRNMRLFLAGAHAAGSALTVAAPITMSGTGCEISDCDIAYGFDADQIVGIGITVTGTRCRIDRTRIWAETAAVPTTTALRLTGADWFEMEDTIIVGPGSSTTIGPVQELTTASLKKYFRRCVFKSTTAVSTVAYTAIAGTGHFSHCGFAVGTGTLAITASSAVTCDNTHTFSAASGLQTLLAIT
jgi:hypothetical protein